VRLPYDKHAPGSSLPEAEVHAALKLLPHPEGGHYRAPFSSRRWGALLLASHRRFQDLDLAGWRTSPARDLSSRRETGGDASRRRPRNSFDASQTLRTPHTSISLSKRSRYWIRSKRAKNHDACTASTNASYRQPPSWGPMEGDEDEFVVPAVRIPRWRRIWMTLWRLIGK
jgi:hypothetical protein